MRFEDFRSLLATDAGEGLFATGLQMCVRFGGEEVFNEAYGVDGLGRQMTPDRIHRLHCSGKPLTALTLASLVEGGILGWDDQIGAILGSALHPTLQPLTVEQLLTHRAGLFRLTARGAELISPERRRSEVASMEAVSPGTDAVYADFAGWHLLGWVIEVLTSESPSSVVKSRILDPLGIAEEMRIGLTAADAASLGYEIAPSVRVTPAGPVPLMLETLPEVVGACEVANGCIGSARALASLYDHMLGALAGSPESVISQDSMRRLVTRRSAHRWDPHMGRTCSYGMGFMVALEHHAFGRFAAESSFGHSGFRGTSYGFADPDAGLAVAAYYNGAVDAETAISFLRTARVEAIYRMLGLAG